MSETYKCPICCRAQTQTLPSVSNHISLLVGRKLQTVRLTRHLTTLLNLMSL